MRMLQAWSQLAQEGVHMDRMGGDFINSNLGKGVGGGEGAPF